MPCVQAAIRGVKFEWKTTGRNCLAGQKKRIGIDFREVHESEQVRRAEWELLRTVC